jgi:hypothetical protein
MATPPEQLPNDEGENLGPGPYRAPPALPALPYDWHRVKIAALAAVCVSVGAMLHAVGPDLVRRAMPGLTESRPEVAGRLPQVTLQGPEGSVTLPMRGPVVVHVWLERCSDCMSAFNAAAKLAQQGGLRVDVPVVNVAYGRADAAWAADYGVGENLVFDPGGASVVRRLNISTFTTIVLDEEGYVRLTDRPDRPGYADRVAGAVRALTSAPL